MKTYTTIANATTATECRAMIGLIMFCSVTPPGSKWDWLLSPFSTPRSRRTAFEEIRPHLPPRDADDLASLLDRLNKAEAA